MMNWILVVIAVLILVVVVYPYLKTRKLRREIYEYEKQPPLGQNFVVNRPIGVGGIINSDDDSESIIFRPTGNEAALSVAISAIEKMNKTREAQNDKV